MLATEYASGGGSGGENTAFLVIVVLLLVGIVLYKLIAPLFKFALGVLETVADLSFKAGLYLIGAGAVALVLAFGYLMLQGT
jgi:hypothetical protein